LVVARGIEQGIGQVQVHVAAFAEGSPGDRDLILANDLRLLGGGAVEGAPTVLGLEMPMTLC